MSIDDFLRSLGIADHPGLRVNQRQEGYANYSFGCRAGPSKANVMDLSHELAHACQFGPAAFKTRASERGFVFHVRRVEFKGQLYTEPLSCQGIERELETCAYQLHLLEKSGYTFNREKALDQWAYLMVAFMPDWWHIPGDSEKERKAWCRQKIEFWYGKITQEKALSRLTGWLGKTEKLLAKQANKTEKTYA